MNEPWSTVFCDHPKSSCAFLPSYWILLQCVLVLELSHDLSLKHKHDQFDQFSLMFLYSLREPMHTENIHFFMFILIYYFIRQGAIIARFLVLEELVSSQFSFNSDRMEW